MSLCVSYHLVTALGRQLRDKTKDRERERWGIKKVRYRERGIWREGKSERGIPTERETERSTKQDKKIIDS